MSHDDFWGTVGALSYAVIIVALTLVFLIILISLPINPFIPISFGVLAQLLVRFADFKLDKPKRKEKPPISQ